MARIRTIKPEFPQSESMGRVSRDARLCFIQLWTIADDAGRLRGNSRMLASLLYPYDDDAKDLMDGWLTELEGEGCIDRYQSEGATYIQINAWTEHQKIDKPSQSKIPEPTGEKPAIRQPVANPLESSRSVVVGMEGNGKDQGREGDQGGEKSRAPRSTPLPKPDDVSTQVWADWCQLRKAKKATVSETVLKEARAEAAKAGLTLERFLTIWCARGSQGLQADWLKPSERAPHPTLQPGQVSESTAEAARLLGFSLTTDAGVIDA